MAKASAKNSFRDVLNWPQRHFKIGYLTIADIGRIKKPHLEQLFHVSELDELLNAPWLFLQEIG